MTDPISSSKWTGPLDEGLGQWRHGAFTHGVGEPSFTGDYARIAEARRLAGLIPPELRRVIGLAVLLLISPLLLWIGWLILRSASRDPIVEDNGAVLIAFGLGVIALAVWQIGSRSVQLIWFRKAILLSALLATVALPAAYVYFGLKSHSRATASAAERTYEWHETSGRSPFQRVDSFHQRPDGTTVEGTNAGRPFEYGRSCALVQRLDGEYGFSWIRVLDRSRAPARGQLSLPIRREECFSEIPLSTLPR